MKLAIPVEDKDINSNVCMSFGRTAYFLIYDLDKKESTFLDNSAAASVGGAGIKASQMLVDNDVKVLLTPRCGENAVEVLKPAGIVIYRTKLTSIKESIEAYLDGKLELLTEVHSGFHGNGGN